MGLSPYDRKQYRESKRRRRQALAQSETGFIKPYRRRNKTLLIVVGVAVLCAAAVAAAVSFRHVSLPHPGVSAGAAALSRSERLRPVNKSHPLEKSDVPPLTGYNGVKVHKAIVGELSAMCEAAKRQGISPKIVKGYVSYDEQQQLYEQNLAAFLKQPDYTQVRAQAAARRVVPEAGCCEAQTGLYVEFDVTDARVKAFLERECIRYGFIRRFAENKEEQTHIQHSDAAYRYVGKEDAEKMRAFDMCLEEYNDYLDSQSTVTLS